MHMKYFERIDGMRALAVGAVMMSHYVPHKYQLGIPWGGFGVHLFFVISGFLITRILRSAMGQPMSKSLLIFYTRRFLRIFPLYYFCLLWISALGWGLDFGIKSLWHWGYASNWLFWWEGHWSGSVSHFWSLAVEEQFYLLWPIFFLSVGNKSRGYWVALLLTIGGFFFRVYAQYSVIGEARLWDFTTPACLESLGFGALLAHVWRKWSIARIGAVFALSTLVLLGVILLMNQGGLSSEWRFQAFLIWAVAALWYLCRANWTALDWFFLNTIVRYLGMISYGLYVWHNFMGYPWHAVSLFMGFPEWLEYGLGGMIGKTVLTIVFSTLTWYGFEKPLLRLKGRLNYAS